MGYTISEVICVKCGHRWIAVRAEETLLKNLECKHCGKGYVIETGQTIEEGDTYDNFFGDDRFEE